MDATQFAELIQVIKQCAGLVTGSVLSLILATTWKG